MRRLNIYCVITLLVWIGVIAFTMWLAERTCRGDWVEIDGEDVIVG